MKQLKDITSIRNWFNKNFKYSSDKDVYLYTLSSLTSEKILQLMIDEMNSNPTFEERKELIDRISPSSYKKNPRQRWNFIEQTDIENPKLLYLILYIIDYLLRALSTNRNLYNEYTDDISLPSKVLLKVYADSNLTFWAVRIAKALNIIEHSSAHSTFRGVSRGFRIHSDHLRNPDNHIVSEICADKTIASNIRENRWGAKGKGQTRKELIYKSPVLLYSYYYLNKLRIHWEAVDNFILQWKNELLNQVNQDDFQGIMRVYVKYLSYVITIARIRDNDFFITRDDYGRIHSNLTNCPRIVRPFLYFEDNSEPLYQLDLSNSQPLLLAVLFPEYFKNKYRKNLDSVNKLQQFCSKNGFDDVLRYIELAQNGELYPELYRIWNNLREPIGRKLTSEEKDEIKENFYTLLFGRKEDIERIDDLVHAFEVEFKTVWDIIETLKRKSHKHLAHKLQKAESAIFIDNVLHKLLVNERYPHVLSIHDCIICSESMIPTVKEKIKEGFGKAKFKFDHFTLKIEGLNEKFSDKNEVLRFQITS